MKFSNPKILEGINTTTGNPLKEMVTLASGVIGLVVLAAVLLGYLLDWTTKYIPFEYEQQLVSPFAKEFMSEPNEIDDYLQKLADKITPLMALPEGVTITVHYVDEEIVNAMATLGGHVFIYRGILEKLPSENALVALLGHEIGHVKLRHPLKALNKTLLINLLFTLIGGQSSDDVASLLADTSFLTLLSFSRSQEQAADFEALHVSQKLYQHGRGVIELLDVLAVQSEQTSLVSLPFLNTHPEVQVRISLLKTTASEKHWSMAGSSQTLPDIVSSQLLQEDESSKEGNE